MYRVKGIDVSHHQGKIDFRKVKNSGIGFAMLRAGYGWENPSVQTDRMFKNNYESAKAAGLPCGAYHYSYARNPREAQLEASFFLNIVKGCKFEYPVAFDLEDKSQAGLSRKMLTYTVVAFCDKLEKAGYYVCLYTNPNWIKNHLDICRIKRFDIWLARYNISPGYKNIGMWQYSNCGKINGINTRVDLDFAYKNYPYIIKENGLNGFKRKS